MTTNINLTASDAIEKKAISGKSSLVFALILIIAVVLIYAALIVLNRSYESQKEKVTAELLQENNRIKGTEFAEAIDFQSRLNLLDKIIDDHNYWDSMLRKISGYVLTDVKFTKLSGKKNTDGTVAVEIEGTAANLDTVSRELILLKTFPDLKNLEFKSAEEKTQNNQQNNQQNNIVFQANFVLAKPAFQK